MTTGAPKSGLRGEGRQHLGHDAHGRQDQDVDLGMAEDPEEVLPEERVGAAGGRVEERAEEAVEHQQDQRHRDRGERQDDQELDHEAHPHEERHPHQRHAGRAHVDDGHDEVEACHQRRNAEYLQAQHPEVDAVGRRELRRGEVGVPEPAAVRDSIHEEAQMQEEGAGEEDPVGQGVQPRERHVAGPDHERDHVVEERRAHRHDRQEHHGRAVHGEQLVEARGADQRVVRVRELQAHDDGLQPSHQEEEEGGDAVELADSLVVHGRDPGPEDGAGACLRAGHVRRVSRHEGPLISGSGDKRRALSAARPAGPGPASARRA